MQIIDVFFITNKSAPLCTYYVVIIKYNILHVLIKNVYSRLSLCYVSYYIKYKTRTFLYLMCFLGNDDYYQNIYSDLCQIYY